MFPRNLNPFYSPEDTIESGKMSVSDMTEFLSKDEDPPIEELEVPDEDEESEDKEDEPKKESLEDELEEDLKEVDDDEVVMPVRRKEVLAKYPNIFKDFPHLDKAVYREQKYSEILPSLQDAKVAVDKANTLDTFSKDLSEGKTTTILQAVKEEDPEAFNSLVDNYLGNLQAVDRDAYFHVLGNVMKHTIIAMSKEEDADMKTAALLLNRFIFQSDKVPPISNLSSRSVEKDDREAKIEEREQNFRKEQLDSHVATINTRIENSIKSVIDKNIDPKGSMNDYVKQKAIRDCSEQLDEEISKDTRFRGLLDKMWERASENSFNQESMDKIRSAYLSKARGLLPTFIRKVRSEALRGLGNKSPNENRSPLPVGRPSSTTKKDERPRSSGSSDKDKARALPKDMKSIDYLMKD